MKRRKSLKKLGLIGLSLSAPTMLLNCKSTHNLEALQKINEAHLSFSKLFFKISLAQWSLHRSLKSGKLDHLDFAAKAKSFDIDAIEYVNQFCQTAFDYDRW